MEESNLLKERLQAITEKHHIQEHIRQKKLELDQEKLKLLHLKKKALRDHWLLQDSASHNVADSQKQQSLMFDQQQTRALQVNIHRIEMEILSLEQEESMITTHESIILNRLKAVEKSPEEIIKEAQINFFEPSLHTMLIPESLSPLTNNYTEPNTPRKTLFAQDFTATKNLLTGKNTVLYTAAVPPEELNQHTGLKVYSDSRTCVYALNSQKGSHDLRCMSELSANEVEQSLRSDTEQRQIDYHQTQQSREGHFSYNHQDVSHVLSHSRAQKELQDEHCYLYQDSNYSKQEEGNTQRNLRDIHHFGKLKEQRPQNGSQLNSHYSSFSQNTISFIKACSKVNGGRPNGYPPPSPHHHEAVSYQPQLREYVSVTEQEFSSYSHPSQIENHTTSLYHGPSASDKASSPLYRDDTPFTILNTYDTTEPITAIFMGFQAAQDDSGWSQEFVGSQKAELVIIEDKAHNQLDASGYSTGNATRGNLGCVDGFGNKQTVRQVGSHIRKIHKIHKSCCSVS